MRLLHFLLVLRAISTYHSFSVLFSLAVCLKRLIIFYALHGGAKVRVLGLDRVEVSTTLFVGRKLNVVSLATGASKVMTATFVGYQGTHGVHEVFG